VVDLLDVAEELHAKLQPGFFALPSPSKGPRRIFPADADEQLLVAEDRLGAIRGLLRARIHESAPESGMVRARRMLVEELVVDPTKRRRGCGRALLDAARLWGRTRGARQLVLTVWEGNGEAERFYAKLGYRRISQVLGTDL
jgi:GNAT superfamily N-acetyltransferase